MPDFKLREPDDYYVWYVLVLEIPEGLFWDSDVSMLRDVAESKRAFDCWEAGEQRRLADRRS